VAATREIGDVSGVQTSGAEPVGLVDRSVVAHILGQTPEDVAGSRHTTASPPFCILIAGRDADTRSELRRVLEADERINPCSEARDAPAALALALRRHPHLCLIDVTLPGGGLAAAREIMARRPSTKIVMRTQACERTELLACLQAGASGYIDEAQDLARLPEVLVRVLEGEVAIPRSLVGWLTEHFRSPTTLRRSVASASATPLTSREWEVFDLLCRGSSTAQIAETLQVSKGTVRTHVASILSKLGVPDRAAAIELCGRES